LISALQKANSPSAASRITSAIAKLSADCP
jgi:hypothetical protein